MRNTTVGGQAVIEGVMMRGLQGIATAVRNPEGNIVVNHDFDFPFLAFSIFCIHSV